ncbi:hypothetical protein BH11PLA2_BH11PLA2_20750 [soil metagenome]
MRPLVAIMLVGMILPHLRAAEPPLVERYLHAGELAKGEQALEFALGAEPKDDQLRFGLGFLQFFRGVERLGQSLHEYGIKSEHQNLPFLRLPIDPNPDASPITYPAFRRILEQMHRDLATAESTLAKITDDNVKLPIRLAKIRLDLHDNGKRVPFVDIMKRIMRVNTLEFLKNNPDFEVHFDRGDVAWFRGYCHLLMGMLDVYLSADSEDAFDHFAAEAFAKPKRRLPGKPEISSDKPIVMKETARLGHFRKHLLAVCELNRESWKFIRAETDNDYEWLPNPKQQSAIGLPVRAEMVDTWLTMMAELEDLLNGKKIIPQAILRFVWPSIEGGLNMKRLLDDPPEKFDWDSITKNGPQAKYLDKKGDSFDVGVIFSTFQMFNDPMGMGYMAWFN